MHTLLSIICLQVLIVFHELGHYLFARRFGMRVSRFSVGFGPKLFGWTQGETVFQVAAVPLGGFVQIIGMNPEDGIDATDKNAYPNKPMWQRFIVVLMGPVMNFALAFVFLTLAFGHGVEQSDVSKPLIGAVDVGSPAEHAGLLAGDELLTINGERVATFEDVPGLIQKTPETAPVKIQARRQGNELSIAVAPPEKAQSSRVIGIRPPLVMVKSTSLMGAIGDGAEATWSKSVATLKALGSLVTGHSSGRLMGLPGIVKTIGGQADRGASALLLLLAVLSINLGLFNLLPVPALDGGRLVFLGIEGVMRRPVDVKIENLVHTVGIALVFGLIIFTSIRDLFV